jgi:hypothetical protein
LAIKTLQNQFIFGVSAFAKFSFWQRFASEKQFAPDTTMWVKKPEHTQKEEQ